MSFVTEAVWQFHTFNGLKTLNMWDGVVYSERYFFGKVVVRKIKEKLPLSYWKGNRIGLLKVQIGLKKFIIRSHIKGHRIWGSLRSDVDSYKSSAFGCKRKECRSPNSSICPSFKQDKRFLWHQRYRHLIVFFVNHLI